MLLIISRCAGVFLRNTLKPSVLSLTECHSYQEPISGKLMEENRFRFRHLFGASAGLLLTACEGTIFSPRWGSDREFVRV